MGLDSFNKNVSRRDVLRGARDLAAASILPIPDTATQLSVEIPVAPIAQSETGPRLESVTEEEVRAIFGILLGSTPFAETRKRNDANGLHLLEVKAPQADGYAEYSYRRGRTEKNELLDWRVDVTFYNETDMPVGGHSVAKKIEGRWSLTP